jgi:outer membrane biosynthesis protein TonB
MMFHRSKQPVIVHSQDELDALGSEWSTRLFTGEEPEQPEAEERPEPEEQPEEEPKPEPIVEHPKRKPPHRKGQTSTSNSRKSRKGN